MPENVRGNSGETSIGAELLDRQSFEKENWNYVVWKRTLCADRHCPIRKLKRIKSGRTS